MRSSRAGTIGVERGGGVGGETKGSRRAGEGATRDEGRRGRDRGARRAAKCARKRRGCGRGRRGRRCEEGERAAKREAAALAAKIREEVERELARERAEEENARAERACAEEGARAKTTTVYSKVVPDGTALELSGDVELAPEPERKKVPAATPQKSPTKPEKPPAETKTASAEKPAKEERRGKAARGDEGAGTGEEIGAETVQGGVVAAEREKARGEAVAIAARDESSDERRVQGEDSTARAQGDVDDDATGWASERAW